MGLISWCKSLRGSHFPLFMVTKLSHMKTSPPLSVTQELFWPKYCHISRMSFPFLSFLKTSVCWTLRASGDDSPVIMIDLWSHCCGLNFSQSRRNIPCQFSQKVFPKLRFCDGQAACGKIIQESYHITTQLGYYILAQLRNPYSLISELLFWKGVGQLVHLEKVLYWDMMNYFFETI